MRTSIDFTTDEILCLDPKILTEALTLFQQLISWVDNDVFTDAPERAESVAGAEATLQLAHQVMEKIEKTFDAQAIEDGKIIQSRLAPQLLMMVQADESQANRILDEAEEAFGARSLARERVACGNWAQPETVADYLLWIEDEATLQEETGEDPIYARALRGIADEIRALGFQPSPPPWEKAVVEEL
jgi:hypothetical protein